MKDGKKRTYQEFSIEIKKLDENLIRTSSELEQQEVGIQWNKSWSNSWER